jgi:hypothetical protein
MKINDLLESKQQVNEAWDDALGGLIDSISDAFGNRAAKPEQILRVLAQEAQGQLYNVVMNVHNWAKARPHVDPDKEIHRVVQGWFEGGANLGTAPHSSGEDQPVSSHWIGSERTTGSVKSQQYIRSAIEFREAIAPLVKQLKSNAETAIQFSNRILGNNQSSIAKRDEFFQGVGKVLKQRLTVKNPSSFFDNSPDEHAFANMINSIIDNVVADYISKHQEEWKALSLKSMTPETDWEALLKSMTPEHDVDMSNVNASRKYPTKEAALNAIRSATRQILVSVLAYRAMSIIIDQINYKEIKLQQDPKLKVGDVPYTDRTQRIIGDSTTMKAFDQIVDVAITNPAMLKSKKMLPAFETMLGDAVYEYTKDRYGRPRVQAAKDQSDSKDKAGEKEEAKKWNAKARARESRLNTLPVEPKYNTDPYNWGGKYLSDDPMIDAADVNDLDNYPNVIQPVKIAHIYSDAGDDTSSVYVKLDGRWYVSSYPYDGNLPDDQKQKLQLTSASDPDIGNLNQWGLQYVSPWAIKRRGTEKSKHRMLSVDELKDWVKATNRTVQSEMFSHPPYRHDPENWSGGYDFYTQSEETVQQTSSAAKRKKERIQSKIKQDLDEL